MIITISSPLLPILVYVIVIIDEWKHLNKERIGLDEKFYEMGRLSFLSGFVGLTKNWA